MREGCNEAHSCLTSEVPSLASWGRLRHNYPPNLWPLQSPKIIPHSPIHFMKRKEFLRTHISPTHSRVFFFISNESVYRSIFIAHYEMLQMLLYMLVYNFFVCLFVFWYVLNKSTTFVAAITGAFNTGHDGLTSYPPAILGQSKEAHEIYKCFGHVQPTAKLTCSIIMGECVMIVVKSFTDGTEGNKLVLSGIDVVVIGPHSPHVSCTVDQPGRIKDHSISQQTRN